MLKTPYARLIPVVLVSALLCCRHNPVSPTATTECTAHVRYVMSDDSPRDPARKITVQTIVDGFAYNPSPVFPGYDVNSWILGQVFGGPAGFQGHHVVEAVMIEQPVSPTSYTLSPKVEIWGTVGTGPICGRVVRTVPISTQTALLATGERFIIPFDL